ncbi:pilus biosynthesis protein PilZ [Sulfurospirillum deleyianum]|uniref:Type IV pilus assembly PilZ n=1 Tax=Sulfurospirillum deleyianum (strain ATCC 51133 / DSM 6946 / 5175) TaxID=525898 RepID=D1B2I2_SULD5|nr:pilus biosynthesis protein PilZ [Sulfurospirillum deleyianum]ACZ12302.1 type IV pilus assembly PilZ [Sulfurospirillum deleyianum DSM 6946]
MLLEEFLQETRYLSIGHLYFHEAKLTLFENAKKKFAHFVTVDVEHEMKTFPDMDVLLIEIGDVSKEKLKRLVSLFTKYKPIVTYLFTDDIENKLLLKFALHFGITDVLPLLNQEKTLLSIFSKNPNKLDEKLHLFKKTELETKIEQFFPFFLFQGNHLVYANAKAQRLYETNEVALIEDKMYCDEDVLALLENKSDAHGMIVLDDVYYMAIVKCFPKKNEKILTLMSDFPRGEIKDCSFMLNRFDFVDQLKDRLAQQSVTQTEIALTFILISNSEKLSKNFSGSALHETLKRVLNLLFDLTEEDQALVQWSPNLYLIMSEKRHFEHVCKQAKHIQKELINTPFHPQIKPVIVTSAMEIDAIDLSQSIEIIEKINTQTLVPHDVEHIAYYEVAYLDNILDEGEQIAYLMHHAIQNKLPIKLLNIYKGLCINTTSTVLKMSNNTYHISCENLQGYAMQLEGETVLQASNFPKDIRAEVAFLDIKKSFAIIKNLSFLPNSANSRQHTRVQTSFRTPIVIKYAKRSSAQGDILDISVNSIAMKIKKLFREEELKESKVHLNFSLPNDTGEYGYVIMDIDAKVTHISQLDEDHTKVVVLLDDLPKPYDEYLLHYMYARQKELILEIRRATKAYN